MLVQTGAHYSEPPTAVGEAMVGAAFGGNIAALRNFIIAGIDPNQPNVVGCTALHAVSVQSLKCFNVC